MKKVMIAGVGLTASVYALGVLTDFVVGKQIDRERLLKTKMK
ncbi:hypothetical protein [Alteribacter aurantiacus]|nr:hypothetical protein [Alteribacter aurantiacus]